MQRFSLLCVRLRDLLVAPVVVLVVILGGCATPSIDEQGVGATNIRDVATIPGGYRTYTLFISTSYDYAGLGNSGVVSQTLARRFKRFGTAIGEDNYAAFVSDPATGRLDVAAGRTILDKLKGWYHLSNPYSDGPYVIVLQRHPASAPVGDESAAVISLKGQSAERVMSILDELEAELNTQHAARPPTGGFAAFWKGMRQGWASSGLGAVRGLASIYVASPAAE